MTTFGERMRRLMAERGISLRKLAKTVHYDAGGLSKVSRDLKPPSPEMARVLDDALSADGELVELARTERQASRVTTELPRPNGPVAPELIDYFREQLPGHYRADMFLGPHLLIPTVVAQVNLIEQLTETAETRVRRGLLEMGVAYAALLGWLYQDAADLDRSTRWRSHALDMAHRTADAQLVSYALSNKAMHSVDLGEGVTIIDYAEAALATESQLCPKVRVLALVHKAHGHAFLTDAAAADRALDAAERLITAVDDDYLWANACRRTPRYVDIQRATAYGRAGVHDRAAALWDEILGGQPEAFRRDTGVFWARHAAALAAGRDPEPEKVVRIVRIAADACDETGSERLRHELAGLPRHAARWARTQHGRELAEIVTAIT